MIVYVKDWFFTKMKVENRNIHLRYGAAQVARETEKAYLLEIEYCTLDGEYDGVKKLWCPKSCTLTEEEYTQEQEAAQARYEDGCKRYEELLAFAKSHGVKGVRSGMKMATIRAKIEAAGIAI